MEATNANHTDGLGIHFDDGTTDADGLQIFCHRIGHSNREFTKDPDKVTCEACRHRLIGTGRIRPTVGMGATEFLYTDRHALTVIEVSASGKTVKLQEDTATRTDANGQSESQSYAFAPDPKGAVVTVRLTKHGWRSKGRRFAIGFREAYHDYSF